MKDKYSSKAQAENGIDNTTIMTPLRVKQSILVNSPSSPQAQQSDWNEADPTNPSYIKNKPVIPTKTSDLTNDSNFVVDASYVHTDNNYTTTEKTKLSNIEDGAEANVQSDWNEADNTKDDYIKNKPTINDATLTIQKNSTTLGTFTANSSTPTTVDITVPTKVSDLTNDTGFITATDFATDNTGGTVIADDYYGLGMSSSGQLRALNLTYAEYSAISNRAFISKGTLTHVLTNEGYLTSETDPVYSASAAATITSTDITNWNAAEPNVIEEVQVDGVPLTVTNKSVNITGKQDTLVSGTNIKTINNQSLLGSGDIQVGGGGSSTDVQINGTSITSGGVADIITKGTYDAITNKILTEDDMTGKVYYFSEASLLNMTSTSDATFQRLNEALDANHLGRIIIRKTNMIGTYNKDCAVIKVMSDGYLTTPLSEAILYYFDLDDNYAEMTITQSSGVVTATKRILGSVSRGCVVGQSGNGTSNPYYKFADISIPSSTNWYDDTITFKVTRGFADGTTATGILSAHIRTQGSGYWESGELMWEYANKGIDYDKFFICHNTGTAPAIAELYVKCDVAYVCWHFEVLQECNRVERNLVLWNLYDNTATNGGSASLPSTLTTTTSFYSELRNDWKVAWLPMGGSSIEPLPIPFPDYTNEEATLGWLPEYKLDFEEGTTSSVGHCNLILGNDKASGTNLNSRGVITLYTSGTGTHTIVSGTHNNFRSHALPDKTGTFAMTSDIPTVNNGTLTIQKNGSTVATFTANQSGNATANITGIPEFSEGTGVVSRSSGATLEGSSFKKWGRVVQLRINIKSGSSSTSVGSDCFKGTLNRTDLRPIMNTGGMGFQSSTGLIFYVDTSGEINVRVIGAAFGTNKTAGGTITYLTAS